MKRLKKRKIQQKVYSWPVVVVLGIVAFFFVINTWDVYKKYAQSKHNVAGLAETFDSSEQREKELQEKIAYLKSDKGLESEIREKFNVAKEGEEVIVIVDAKREEVHVEITKENLFQNIWGKIISVFR